MLHAQVRCFCLCVFYLLNVIQIHFLNANKKGRCWNGVVSFILSATLLSVLGSMCTELHPVVMAKVCPILIMKSLKGL